MEKIIIIFISLLCLYFGISNFIREYKKMAEGEEHSLSVILGAALCLLITASAIAIIIVNIFDIKSLINPINL